MFFAGKMNIEHRNLRGVQRFVGTIAVRWDSSFGKGCAPDRVQLLQIHPFGEELKNRYMHVEFEKQSVIQSATNNDSKCQSCTFEELAIIQEIKKNPAITQREQ